MNKKKEPKKRDWRSEYACYHGHCVTSKRDLLKDGLKPKNKK